MQIKDCNRDNKGERKSYRRGAALSLSLILLLFCIIASFAAISQRNAVTRIFEANDKYEKKYYAASSAARLIKDSMNLSNMNVLTLVCLQYANGSGDVLTVIVKAPGLPDAVCTVIFDEMLNLEARVEVAPIVIRLTMPASVPGVIGWDEKDALTELVERG